MQVLAVSGSLRRASFNTGLLRAAREVAPENVAIEVASISDVPLFNEDIEREGWPAPVVALRRRAYQADALLFACPEYNYGITGVLKNAFDWISRPEGAGGHTAPAGRSPVPRNPFQDKPCALFGASPGMGGTIRAQLTLRQSLQLNGALTMPQPETFIAGARDKFDADGDLVDTATREFLARFVTAFVAWVERVHAAESRPRPAPPRESGGPRQSGPS